MNQLAVSIVLYNNSKAEILRCLNSLLTADECKQVTVIDNSPFDKISRNLPNNEIIYIHQKNNHGYGRSHNVALRKSIESGYKYHLVLNPDIYFDSCVLKRIISFMDANKEIGLLMPKVLYPDGQIQYLCKLLPSPFDLFRRRFLPDIGVFKKWNRAYELRFADFDKQMEVPYLSGCFMFFRVEALKKVGLFDERFFMYMEDVDISRRINEFYKTVYFPESYVYHAYQKGSYKSFRLLKAHLTAAFKYFNKWGWIFDKKRKKTNRTTVKSLMNSHDETSRVNTEKHIKVPFF